MFEIVTPRPRSLRDRLVRLVRAAADPERCVVLSRVQRIARALVWFFLGTLFAAYTHAWRDANFPTPVHVLQPRVEHASERMTILLFGFEYRGGTTACRLVMYRNERRDWSIQC